MREFDSLAKMKVTHDLTFGPNSDWLNKAADIMEKFENIFEVRKPKASVETRSVEEVIEITGHPQV